MDFWDVAKVLVRRWFISVPLLIITAVTAGLVASKVNPDYVATVHVALVEGSVTRPSQPGRSTVSNPWEPTALAEAATIQVKTKLVSDSMKAAGFTGEWTVDTGDGELAVIKIEVAAPTPDQSVLTAQHLVALIVTDVKQRQTKLNLTPGETITTQQLEAAPTVEKKSIKIIRAIVVIAAAGLILTLGLVLAVDAIIRRRSRRKTTANWSGLNASSRVAMPSAPVGPSLPAGSTGRVRLGSAAAQNSDHTIVLSRVVAIDPVEPASPVSPAGSDILAPSRSSGSASAQLSPSSAHLDGLDVNYETGQAYDDIDSADSDGVLPEDSTIVLPLSNSQGWRHTNGGRPAGAARP